MTIKGESRRRKPQNFRGRSSALQRQQQIPCPWQAGSRSQSAAGSLRQDTQGRRNDNQKRKLRANIERLYFARSSGFIRIRGTRLGESRAAQQAAPLQKSKSRSLGPSPKGRSRPRDDNNLRVRGTRLGSRALPASGQAGQPFVTQGKQARLGGQAAALQKSKSRSLGPSPERRSRPRDDNNLRVRGTRLGSRVLPASGQAGAALRDSG